MLDTIGALLKLIFSFVVALFTPVEEAPSADLEAEMRARFVYFDAPLSAHTMIGPVWANDDRVVFADRSKRVAVWQPGGEAPEIIGTVVVNICATNDGHVRWRETGEWNDLDKLQRFAELLPDGRVERHKARQTRFYWNCAIKRTGEDRFELPGGAEVHLPFKAAASLQTDGLAPVGLPFQGRTVSATCVQYIRGKNNYFFYECSNNNSMTCNKFWHVHPERGVEKEGCFPIPRGRTASSLSKIFWTPSGYVMSFLPHDNLRPSLWFYDGTYHVLDAGVAMGVEISPDDSAITYASARSITQMFHGREPVVMRVIRFDRGETARAPVQDAGTSSPE